MYEYVIWLIKMKIWGHICHYIYGALLYSLAGVCVPFLCYFCIFICPNLALSMCWRDDHWRAMTQECHEYTNICAIHAYVIDERKCGEVVE